MVEVVGFDNEDVTFPMTDRLTFPFGLKAAGFGIELDDARILAVLDKMLKQRRDSITQYEAADRQDSIGQLASPNGDQNAQRNRQRP